MATVRISESVSEGSFSKANNIDYTCATISKIDGETVADGVTDGAFVFAVDVSALKAFYIISDQAVTVETNDGTTPDDTISLTANKPVTWRENDTALFSADVTILYITNASGSTATIYALAGMDV